MARKNADGAGFKAFVQYRLGRNLSVADLSEALGIHRSTYYTRVDEPNFPNAEECRLVARAFDLNTLDLLVEFGLIEEREVEAYYQGPLPTRSTTTRASRRRAPRKMRLEDMVLDPAVSQV